MRASTRSTYTGPNCPAEPLPGSKPHGPMISREHAAPGRTFYCPHADHTGRPASHPQGKADPSRAFFGVDEVTYA